MLDRKQMEFKRTKEGKRLPPICLQISNAPSGINRQSFSFAVRLITNSAQGVQVSGFRAVASALSS